VLWCKSVHSSTIQNEDEEPNILCQTRCEEYGEAWVMSAGKKNKIQVSTSKSVTLDIFIFLNSWKKIVEGGVELSVLPFARPSFLHVFSQAGRVFALS